MTPRTTIRSAIAAAIILVGVTARPSPVRADFAADSTGLYGAWKWVESIGTMVPGTQVIRDHEAILSIFPNSRFFFRDVERSSLRAVSHGNVVIRRSRERMGDGPPARIEVELTGGGKMWVFHCFLATYRNANEVMIYPGGCGGIVLDASYMIFKRVKRTAQPESTMIYDFPMAPTQSAPVPPFDTLLFRPARSK